MAKTPALSTQLKAANTRIEELQKKLDDTTKQKDSHYEERTKHANEIEQIQQVLDAVPNCIPRRAEGEYIDRRALTRLAAWLAQRNS